MIPTRSPRSRPFSLSRSRDARGPLVESVVVDDGVVELERRPVAEALGGLGDDAARFSLTRFLPRGARRGRSSSVNARGSGRVTRRCGPVHPGLHRARRAELAADGGTRAARARDLAEQQAGERLAGHARPWRPRPPPGARSETVMPAPSRALRYHVSGRSPVISWATREALAPGPRGVDGVGERPVDEPGLHRRAGARRLGDGERGRPGASAARPACGGCPGSARARASGRSGARRPASSSASVSASRGEVEVRLTARAGRLGTAEHGGRRRRP